jgi:hypothetical protein
LDINIPFLQCALHEKGTHNVFEVNETGYKKCTMDRVTGNWTSGKDLIPLKEPRRYFFLCGNSLCHAGMKVIITIQPAPAMPTHHWPQIQPDCSPDCSPAAASLTATAWLTVATIAVAIAAVD